jgi:hypothetical protein
MVEFEIYPATTILFPIDLIQEVDFNSKIKVIQTTYRYKLLSLDGMVWEPGYEPKKRINEWNLH